MVITFYVAAAIAIVSTVLMITRLNAVHALLYLVVSLLAVATVFFILGAPLVAALEVIVYAGAIMVLFIFVMMMLNIGDRATRMERAWLSPGAWVGPAILAVLLVIEFGYTLRSAGRSELVHETAPKEVALVLFGPYLLGVELVSMLLLAGIVGAYHLGSSSPGERESLDAIESDQQRAVTGGNLVRTGTSGTAGAAQRDVYSDVD
jgi:NADH-quinone oxidoreductase subunit J